MLVKKLEDCDRWFTKDNLCYRYVKDSYDTYELFQDEEGSYIIVKDKKCYISFHESFGTIARVSQRKFYRLHSRKPLTEEEKKMKTYRFYSRIRGAAIKVKAKSKDQAAYLIRKELLRAVGVFDENLNKDTVTLCDQK